MTCGTFHFLSVYPWATWRLVERWTAKRLNASEGGCCREKSKPSVIAWMLNRGNHGFAHVIWSLYAAQRKGWRKCCWGLYSWGQKGTVPPSLTAQGCAGPTHTIKIDQVNFLGTDQLWHFSQYCLKNNCGFTSYFSQQHVKKRLNYSTLFRMQGYVETFSNSRCLLT